MPSSSRVTERPSAMKCCWAVACSWRRAIRRFPPKSTMVRSPRSGEHLRPTEATVIAAYADLHPGKPVTIGRAAPGYRALLLDDSLRPVCPGVVGEICIGGIDMARGYVGLTELTEKRFVPD